MPFNYNLSKLFIRVSTFFHHSDTGPSLYDRFKPFTPEDDRQHEDHSQAFILTLRCSAAGSPLPKFRWTLDGQPLSGLDGVRLSEKVDNSPPFTRLVSELTIQRSQPRLSGVYECSAENLLGYVSHRARVDLAGSPFVRQMLNRKHIAGQSVLIDCPYGGYPLQSVQWFKGEC